MGNSAMHNRLEGKALLEKLKKLEGFNRSGKAKACGYYTISKDGAERAKIGEFIEAILEAKGITIDSDKPQNGRGRMATYQLSVHKNGTIIIGPTYTHQMGLEPGDEFEIKLGYKHIHLQRV